MSKYIRKTIPKQNHRQALFVFSGILILLFISIMIMAGWVARNEEVEPMVTPYADFKVIYVEVTPKPTPTPTPEKKKVVSSHALTNRVVGCTANYPEILPIVKKYYGDNWKPAAHLICRESSFNKHAINPTSGACGLSQSLPCAKMGCDLDDADCQIKWQLDYVNRRYGGINEAWSFWLKKGWY